MYELHRRALLGSRDFRKTFGAAKHKSIPYLGCSLFAVPRFGHPTRALFVPDVSSSYRGKVELLTPQRPLREQNQLKTKQKIVHVDIVPSKQILEELAQPDGKLLKPLLNCKCGLVGIKDLRPERPTQKLRALSLAAVVAPHRQACHFQYGLDR